MEMKHHAAKTWTFAEPQRRPLNRSSLRNKTVRTLSVQGLSVPELAVRQGVQESTVESYLAEAIASGHQYTWQRFGIPEGLLIRVAEAAATHMAEVAARAFETESVGFLSAGGVFEGEEVAGLVRGAEEVDQLGCAVVGWEEDGRGGGLLEEVIGAVEALPGTSAKRVEARVSRAPFSVELQSNCGVFAHAAFADCTSDDDAYLAAAHAAEAAETTTSIGNLRSILCVTPEATHQTAPEQPAVDVPTAESHLTDHMGCGALGESCKFPKHSNDEAQGNRTTEDNNCPTSVPVAPLDRCTSLGLGLPASLDVAALIEERGAITALREQLMRQHVDISYGQLRLVLAHLARLQK